MDEIAALTEQQHELSDLLGPLDDDDWARPSRCDGWSVADVVLHLAQTNEMAIGSAQGRFTDALDTLTRGVQTAGNVDDGADVMVQHQRGAPPSEVRARWQQSADALRAALVDVDPHQRVDWVAGQLTARTLATTRLAETWIHTGDVADALDIALVPGDRLRHVARLAWRTLPYAFDACRARPARPGGVRTRRTVGLTVDVRPRRRSAHDSSWQRRRAVLGGRPARSIPADTDLEADGPDGAEVLELVRTYA